MRISVKYIPSNWKVTMKRYQTHGKVDFLEWYNTETGDTVYNKSIVNELKEEGVL